jgi:hypothetical protein
MASRDKMDLLRSFLGSLPRGAAGKVVRAVEIDRLNDGNVLPHELILESLRPSLRGDETAERAPTPVRLFCRPFEDLLVSDGSPQKRKGHVARGSIAPVWNWLSQTLIPASATTYSLAVKTAAMGHEPEQLAQKAAEFWKTASDTLRNRLAAESGRRAAREALGNDMVVEDAREMALLLAAAPEISELQDALPRTMPSLTEEAVQVFRAVHEKLAARMPDAAPYLAVVLMKRLERPWEVLRLPSAGAQAMAVEAGESRETPVDLGFAGELLLGAIDAHRTAILSADPERFSADALLKHLEGHATISNGVMKELELRHDGARVQQLMNDRKLVSDAMENLITRAPAEIFGALSLHVLENDALALDFSQPTDPGKCARASSYARLIAGGRPLAGAASFDASLKQADSQICAMLKRYNEAIMRELSDADDQKRLNAEQYADLATELSVVLLTPDRSAPACQQSQAAGTSIAA